MLAQKSLTKC